MIKKNSSGEAKKTSVVYVYSTPSSVADCVMQWPTIKMPCGLRAASSSLYRSIATCHVFSNSLGRRGLSGQSMTSWNWQANTVRVVW